MTEPLLLVSDVAIPGWAAALAGLLFLPALGAMLWLARREGRRDGLEEGEAKAKKKSDPPPPPAPNHDATFQLLQQHINDDRAYQNATSQTLREMATLLGNIRDTTTRIDERVSRQGEDINGLRNRQHTLASLVQQLIGRFTGPNGTARFIAAPDDPAE